MKPHRNEGARVSHHEPSRHRRRPTLSRDVTGPSRRNPPLCTSPSCPIRGLNLRTKERAEKKKTTRWATDNPIRPVHWIPGINFGYPVSLPRLAWISTWKHPLEQWFGLTLSEGCCHVLQENITHSLLREAGTRSDLRKGKWFSSRLFLS